MYSADEIFVVINISTYILGVYKDRCLRDITLSVYLVLRLCIWLKAQALGPYTCM